METENNSSMQESKGYIRKLRKSLINDSVHQVVSSMWELNEMYTNYKFQERLTAIDNDYKMMKKYWKEGVVDNMRGEMFHKIVADLDDLLCDMEMERMKCYMPFFKDCRRNIAMSGVDFTLTEVKAQLENFVSDFAMTELLPDNKKKERLTQLHAKHQQYVDLMFNYILCIGSMSKLETEGWTDLLTSPTIDASDRQLLIAAMIINIQNVPQRSKMRCLLNIYEQAEDDYVRQPALVGWTLALHLDYFVLDEKMRQEVRNIMNTPDNVKELMSLQMQILVSMNAEQDSRIMDMEINKVRMTNEYRKIADQLEGKNVDHSLDDVLNSSENNAQMDEWMESISKISDMKKKGSDVFFGSFSQLKNNGFFSKPANWFVNFYLEHPDINSTVNIHPNMASFLNFFGALPMLPTDKYSFVLMTAKMAKQLPPELIKQAFDDFPKETIIPDFHGEDIKGMSIRDSFTKLLYRFYTLFCHRECFDNPMIASQKEMNKATYLFMANSICQDTLLLSDLIPFLKTLYKMGHKYEIFYICKSWMEAKKLHPDVKNEFDFIYFWGAYCNEMANTPRVNTGLDFYNFTHDAIVFLEAARKLRPEMQSITTRLLTSYCKSYNYKKFLDLAEEVNITESSDPKLLCQYGSALYEFERYEEAEKVYYKVIYLSPNEYEAIARLPQILLSLQRYDQAEKLVTGWMESAAIDDSNKKELNEWMGLFFFRKRDFANAVECFATYLIDNHPEDVKISFIKPMLKQYGGSGFDDVDFSLLSGCISDRMNEMKAQKKVSEEGSE